MADTDIEKKPKGKDEKGLGPLQHGRRSAIIKGLQERLDMLPLKDVKKMEFETMLDQMQSTSWAFDFDSAIKMHLIESLQDTDKKLMSYMADLQNTQMRMAKMQKDMAFHQKVLEDLKEAYIEQEDLILKKGIYAEIQETEKSISAFERRIQEYIDLRNKIRKEIDKGKYQDKALKIKEQQSAGNSALDVDFTEL